MPRIETWSCKVCGKLKGNTNAWWLVGIACGRFQIRPMTDDDPPAAAWEDAVCGRDHVQREAELFLAGAS